MWSPFLSATGVLVLLLGLGPAEASRRPDMSGNESQGMKRPRTWSLSDSESESSSHESAMDIGHEGGLRSDKQYRRMEPLTRDLSNLRLCMPPPAANVIGLEALRDRLRAFQLPSSRDHCGSPLVTVRIGYSLDGESVEQLFKLAPDCPLFHLYAYLIRLFSQAPKLSLIDYAVGQGYLFTDLLDPTIRLADIPLSGSGGHGRTRRLAMRVTLASEQESLLLCRRLSAMIGPSE